MKLRRVLSWLGFSREDVAVERIVKKEKMDMFKVQGLAEEPLETSEGE